MKKFRRRLVLVFGGSFRGVSKQLFKGTQPLGITETCICTRERELPTNTGAKAHVERTNHNGGRVFFLLGTHPSSSCGQ